MNRSLLKERLASVTHVVIKLGTGSLTRDDYREFFAQLAREIAELQTTRRVILVSSGAVGFGRKFLNKARGPSLSIVEKQAMAALGQGFLIDEYRRAFADFDVPVAQILVSKSDFSDREHYYNLRHTLQQLLAWDCLPIVNENDSVATEELRFSDNDRIAGLITGMFPQSLLLLLTTASGFILGGQKVDTLHEITPEIIAHAGKPQPGGSGGMYSKILTARQLLKSGQLVHIASGSDPAVIRRIVHNAGETGTWIFSDEKTPPLAALKRWLINLPHFSAAVTVDRGAARALRESNASLLAVGIKSYEGVFSKDDVIGVYDEDHLSIGKGIASLSSETLDALLAGNAVHGHEAIHRDRFVVTDFLS